MKNKEKIKVGFIGLGLMGNPMAKNILKSGFRLSVFNRNKNRTKEISKLGAHIFDTPKELAENSDIVISMVTGPEDVKEVMLGKNGVIHGKHTGLIAVDMSTIGPSSAIEIEKALKKADISFLDAPVTGSVQRAISGELTIFIGGSKNVFEKVKPVFLAMGKNLQYMGDSGTGQAIKLINNIIVASSTTALAEGMILADILKLPRKKVAEALSEVPAISMLMRIKLPNMVKDKYPAAFSVSNMYKDINLALEECKNAKRKLPVLQTVEKLYKNSMKSGRSQEDMSIVLKAIEESE